MATDLKLDEDVDKIEQQTGAVGFCNAIRRVFYKAFGPSTPFGSAAIEDVGNGPNQVPVLDENGELSPDVIPVVPASQFTTGTLPADQIANDIDASQITGVLDADRIAIPATKITTGKLDPERIPKDCLPVGVIKRIIKLRDTRIVDDDSGPMIQIGGDIAGELNSTGTMLCLMERTHYTGTGIRASILQRASEIIGDNYAGMAKADTMALKMALADAAAQGGDVHVDVSEDEEKLDVVSVRRVAPVTAGASLVTVGFGDAVNQSDVASRIAGRLASLLESLAYERVSADMPGDGGDPPWDNPLDPGVPGTPPGPPGMFA